MLRLARPSGRCLCFGVEARRPRQCLETCIFTGGVLGVLMHQIADEEAVSIEEGCAETAFIVWIGALADDVEGVGMLERFLVPIFTSLVEVGAQARRQLLPPIQGSPSSSRGPRSSRSLPVMQDQASNQGHDLGPPPAGISHFFLNIRVLTVLPGTRLLRKRIARGLWFLWLLPV
ncbi:hypothetical protein FB45DRAFT_945617, partial [Roridomyces roridus]